MMLRSDPPHALRPAANAFRLSRIFPAPARPCARGATAVAGLAHVEWPGVFAVHDGDHGTAAMLAWVDDLLRSEGSGTQKARSGCTPFRVLGYVFIGDFWFATRADGSLARDRLRGHKYFGDATATCSRIGWSPARLREHWSAQGLPRLAVLRIEGRYRSASC